VSITAIQRDQPAVANSVITTRSAFRSNTMLDEVVRQFANPIGLASGVEKN